MERYREELTRIRNLLRAHPRGLTITEISRRIGVNRNSVAKYLDVLITSGHVEKKAVGPAKVYFLSPRVPVSALLNLSSDYIIILDEKGKIWHVNNSLLVFEGRKREEVLGRDFDDAPLLLLRDPEVRSRLSGGAPEGEVSFEVDVKKGEEISHFRATLVCTILEDGSRGTTVIFDDITEEKRNAESLRASEARYRAVVESQTEFVCRFRPNGTHVFVNEAYCRYFGKAREEIEDHVFRPTIPEEDRAALRRHFEGLTPEHPLGSIEHRIMMPDGSIRWQRWIDRAIFDEDGRITEYQSVGRDTTDRMVAEEQLRESEEKFRGLAERSYNLIFLLDAEGRITYVSPSAERLSGIPPEKVIGTSFSDHVLAEDLPGAHQAFEKNREGLPTESILVRLKKADGSFVTLETNALPIMKDGKFTGVQVVSRDITGRLQMEKALRESEEKFRNIAERAFDIILVFDGDGRISYANPAIRNAMGYAPEEVIGRLYSDFVPDTDLSRVTWFFEMNRQGLPTQGLTLDVKRRDGSLATLEINAVPIIQEGAFMGLQAVCRDITARRRTERELQESEEKFRTIAERAFDLILVTDGEGRITYVSPSLQQIMGYTPDEVTGSLIFDFVSAADRPRAFQAFERVRQGLPPRGLELSTVRKDGSLAALEIRTTPLSEDGKFTGIQAVCRDITTRRKAEEALRESLETIRSLFEASPYGICLTDENGILVEANQAMEMISGIPHEQALGKPLWEIAHRMLPPGMAQPGGPEGIRSDIERFLSTGRSPPFQSPLEFRMHHPDGSIRSLRINNFVIPSGKGYRMGSIIHDISGLKEREEALQHSEEQFAEMADIAPFPIAIIDGAGRYRYINRRFTEFFGYTLVDVPDGHRWFELAYPDPGERSRAISAWKADLAAFGVGMVRPRQFRIRCRNGECREVLFRPVTMRDGNQLVTYQDLTDQVHTLDSLARSESLYRHLFDTMRCCFTLVEPVLDPAGKPVDLSFIEVNAALERLTGHPREVLLGRRLRELYPRTPEELIQGIASVALQGMPERIAIYHPDLDRYLRIRAYSPIKGQCALIIQTGPPDGSSGPIP